MYTRPVVTEVWDPTQPRLTLNQMRHPALSNARVVSKPRRPVSDRELMRRSAHGAWRYRLPTLG